MLKHNYPFQAVIDGKPNLFRGRRGKVACFPVFRQNASAALAVSVTRETQRRTPQIVENLGKTSVSSDSLKGVAEA